MWRDEKLFVMEIVYLIKYQDFIISNEEFERFSINENAAD